MKYVVTIERVVKETIVYNFDKSSVTEALDTAMDYCDKLNRSAHDQCNNIKTVYHLLKVEGE